MKVGVNLINFGPAASPESLERWTTLAEALGYHLVMISDHIAVTPDVQEKYPAPLYDPFITLAWLAGRTTKIELGTTVIIIPYRDPIHTARMTANIDQISGGRFILGVGVGWAQQEFEALGVPFHKRGAITNDYLRAIKTLWTNEVATYEGPFSTFKDIHATPLPVQKPHPPIWVGGASDAALRRTVRLGTGWHPIRIRLDWLKEDGLPRIKRIADEEGLAVPSLCPRIKLHLTESAMPDGERVAGQGSLDQVHADLAELQSLGADYVLLDTFMDDPEATRNHEPAWSQLMTVAEKVLDLDKQTVR